MKRHYFIPGFVFFCSLARLFPCLLCLFVKQWQCNHVLFNRHIIQLHDSVLKMLLQIIPVSLLFSSFLNKAKQRSLSQSRCCPGPAQWCGYTAGKVLHCLLPSFFPVRVQCKSSTFLPKHLWKHVKHVLPHLTILLTFLDPSSK